MPYRLATRQAMVGRDGFEPSNPKEQIYSLPRLTTSLSSRMVPKAGIEPATYWLQVSCSTNWAISAKWWTLQDSNLWPPACKAGALTNWAKNPINIDINKYIIDIEFCQLVIEKFLNLFIFFYLNQLFFHPNWEQIFE